MRAEKAQGGWEAGKLPGPPGAARTSVPGVPCPCCPHSSQIPSQGSPCFQGSSSQGRTRKRRGPVTTGLGTGINTGKNTRKHSGRMGSRKTSWLPRGCQGGGTPVPGTPCPCSVPSPGLLGPPSLAQAEGRGHWGGRKGNAGAPGADAEGRFPVRKRGGDCRGDPEPLRGGRTPGRGDPDGGGGSKPQIPSGAQIQPGQSSKGSD